MRRINTLIKWIGLGLVAAAVGQELMKPPEERQWHGRIAGFIPYDFRFPTLERVREAYWKPENPNVFTERVLGVGWGINIPVLARRLRELGQAGLSLAGSMISGGA